MSDGSADTRLNNEEFRLVLVGKTGAGKSATGNTILGRQCFESKFAAVSLTMESTKARGTADGQEVAVIDTPGLFDTRVDLDETIANVTQCITFAAPGPHVFLVVIRLGRFTDEERKTVERIQQVFGQAADQYSMVLFTGGDMLEGEDIEEFLDDSPQLQELVARCNGRYHVFNNKSRDRSQVTELLQKIRNMVEKNGGSHYTTEMFQEAERVIEEEKQRILKEREEEIRREREEVERKIREQYEPEMMALREQLEAERERKRKEKEEEEKMEREDTNEEGEREKEKEEEQKEREEKNEQGEGEKKEREDKEREEQGEREEEKKSESEEERKKEIERERSGGEHDRSIEREEREEKCKREKEEQKRETEEGERKMRRLQENYKRDLEEKTTELKQTYEIIARKQAEEKNPLYHLFKSGRSAWTKIKTAFSSLAKAISNNFS